MRYSYLIFGLLLSLSLSHRDDHYANNYGDISLPASSFSYGKGFDIHYQFERNNSITLGIIFKRSDKFFALSFGKKRLHTDVWIFRVYPNKVIAEDAYFIELNKPVDDVALGGKNDINLLGYNIRPDHVVVKINRALNTHDKYDDVIKPGIMDLMWTFGEDPLNMDDVSPADHFRASFLKDDWFINREMEDYHALLHIFCFAFMIDLGILLLRYFRLHRPKFDYRLIHISIMVPMVALSYLAIGIVLYKNWSQPKFGLFRGDLIVDYHMTAGLALAIYFPFQALLGLATYLGLRIPFVKTIHITMGYLVYIFSKINIVVGSFFHEEGTWKIPIITYVMLVLMIHMQVRQFTKPPIAEKSKVQ
jgi:hypothetical protein